MIEIEINGATIHAEPGEMLIAVTDREGISVPRFCYHKKLSVAANCRMCLVDVEGAPKPQPACATPVNAGMKVHTNNERATASQKAVMEFLLINHPLDCPICDQGGECELQDVALEYGADVSRFSEGKRIMSDHDIGALIQTDMTRCIHCTRCVRFGVEIAGMMEMGGTGRGEHLTIEPFLAAGITSELSGNMIDVCPVGALTSKPFRYAVRSWQMRSVASVARHDLVGSNVLVQTYKNQVKRVVSADNDLVNETWIADRDRFSYEGLSSENRLLTPQIKVEGAWREVAWQVALDFAVKGLQTHVLNNRTPQQLGGLASNTATVEELFLLQKLLQKLECDNLDTRLNVKNLDAPIVLDSTLTLSELAHVDYALIVGANLRLEQPMINHRLRQAHTCGADIEAINVMAFEFNYPLNAEYITNPNAIAELLAGVLKAIYLAKNEPVPAFLDEILPSTSARNIADKLVKAKRAVLVLGAHSLNNSQAATIGHLIAQIAAKTDSDSLNLSATANALAADLTNFKPRNDGLNANQMLAGEMQAFVLLDVSPEADFHHPAAAIAAFSQPDTFVIALNSFDNPQVADYADVRLPMASFFETSGTHANINGEQQSFAAAVSAPDEAKPGWKILKVLADLLECSGFNYVDSAQVLAQVADLAPVATDIVPTEIVIEPSAGIQTIWQNAPYSTDALLRHSASLQQTPIGQLNAAYLNSRTAVALNLSENDEYLGANVVINDTVAQDCVFVYAKQTTNIEARG